MVVGEDHRSGIVCERSLDDFSRIDTGLSQCAAEHFLGGDEFVLRVEKQDNECLVLVRAEGKGQVIAHRARRRQRAARHHLLGEGAPGHFNDRLQLREFGVAHARNAVKRLAFGSKQAREVAKMAE